MRNVARKFYEGELRAQTVSEKETLRIVLIDIGVDIDHVKCKDVIVVNYEIKKGGYPFYDRGCLVVYEEEWCSDSDFISSDELSLSNAVLILNGINRQKDLWFFNGEKYQIEGEGIKKVVIESYIGKLNQNSAEVLSKHYFDAELELV